MKTKIRKSPKAKEASSPSFNELSPHLTNRAPRTPKEPPSADASTPIPPLTPTKIRTEEKLILLSAMIPSPENRDITDEDIDTDFLESLKQWGIQTAVWLWPLPEGDKRRKGDIGYEIIAGERRWFGGNKAGLGDAPARIFHCTAQQADELRLVENLQRRDLTPIQEGQAFKRMIEKHGFTVDDPKRPELSLKHRLAKSESYIYGRLKLVEAPKFLLDSVKTGELSPSVALRVARIPDPVAQKEAAREVLNSQYSPGAMTDKEAAEHIEENYMRELKGAPFDLKDPKLVPPIIEHGCRVGGGACTDCPSRTGNQPELPGAEREGSKTPKRGDICTNPKCHALKVEAEWKASTAEYLAGGCTILSDQENLTVFQHWRNDNDLPHNSRFVKPSDKIPEDPKGRSYSTLLDLRQGGNPLARFHIARGKSGKPVKLLVRAEAKELLIAAGHKFYEAKAEAKKDDEAQAIIDARETTLLNLEHEWRLCHLIDAITPNILAQQSVVHPIIAEALRHDRYDDGDEEAEVTLQRRAPLPKQVIVGGPMRAWFETASLHNQLAFNLELALRRLRAEFDPGDESDHVLALLHAYEVKLEPAWKSHCIEMEKLRKAGHPLQIHADPDLLKAIDAVHNDDSGRMSGKRPIQSFDWRGLHYANVGHLDMKDGKCCRPNDCYELVPLKAYDGETFPCTEPMCFTNGTGGNSHYEGRVYQAKGIEYALRGPRLKFIPMPGQCTKCSQTELTGIAAWADETRLLCAECSEAKPSKAKHK